MLIENNSDEEDFTESANEAQEKSKLEYNQKLSLLKARFSSQNKDAKSFKAKLSGDIFQNQDILCI